MYREFFQLQDNPFGVTPDPDYLFLSGGHEEAYEHLLYGVRERKGFIELIGEPGTGKTTLCRLFLERAEPRVRTAYLFNTFLSELELLGAICEEFGLKVKGGARRGLVEAINRFLIDVAAEGGNCVLLIDEAHNLSTEALEQLRMLSNLETATEKLLQIVLVGGPELHARLLRPDLKPLNDRMAVRHRLEPLRPEEGEAYIMHRLRVAGWRGSPQLEAGVTREVHRWAKGIPRRINMLCDRALLVAFTRGAQRVERADVNRARQELEALDHVPESRRLHLAAEAAGPMLGRLRQPWAAAGLLVVALGAGGWAWSRGVAPTGAGRLEAGQLVEQESSKIERPAVRLEAEADLKAQAKAKALTLKAAPGVRAAIPVGAAKTATGK